MGRFWLPSKESLNEFKSLQSAMVAAESPHRQLWSQRGSERFPLWLRWTAGGGATALVFAMGFWCGHASAPAQRPPIAERPMQLPHDQMRMGMPRPQSMEIGADAGSPRALRPAKSAQNAVTADRRPLLVQPDR